MLLTTVQCIVVIILVVIGISVITIYLLLFLCIPKSLRMNFNHIYCYIYIYMDSNIMGSITKENISEYTSIVILIQYNICILSYSIGYHMISAYLLYFHHLLYTHIREKNNTDISKHFFYFFHVPPT